MSQGLHRLQYRGSREEGIFITRKQYMAELTKLLGFMSSWDRQKVLKEYEEKFSACESEERLMEELGTPTKNAVALASAYVPSPPPSAGTERQEFQTEEKPAEIQIGFEDIMEPEEAEELSARRETGKAKPVSLFGGIAFGVLAVVIGVPVTVIAVCIGLPFLGTGAGLVFTDVILALKIIAGLHLLSDVLLTAGAALVLCAAGLLLCWFGLWISMELCYLWVGKVLFALGKKIMHREENAE